MKYIMLSFFLITLLSCTENNEKEIDIFLNCSEISENYKEYNGEEIDCQFHYVLTEYKNEKFIELRAHCADLTRSFVINQNCEDICENAPNQVNSDCNDYLSNRQDIEILLISK